MDQRDPMALSGSTYYMQRGMGGLGSGLQGSPAIRPLSNQNVSFQSIIGGSSMGSTLPLETSAVISSHGVNVSAPLAMPAAESAKRRRGRPRKYGPEGSMALALSPTSSAPPPVTVSPNQKRGRGRPPGTGRKQQLGSLGEWLSGTAGMGFTPHVILIAVGEDITTKIISFSQQGRRAICILSANGSVSTVTLRQPSTTGGSVTYEGQFEILCLSGSYLLTDNAGSRGQTGGLSVSLASPDGRVIGGVVGGMLIAASPVQVIVGSFVWGGSKTKNKARGGAKVYEGSAADGQVAQASVPPNQNLSLPSPVGIWPGSRTLDMQTMPVDIDLMRE